MSQWLQYAIHGVAGEQGNLRRAMALLDSYRYAMALFGNYSRYHNLDLSFDTPYTPHTS